MLLQKLTFESGCCALEKEFRNVVQADSMVADAALIIESLDQEFGQPLLKQVWVASVFLCISWQLLQNMVGSTYAHTH